MKEPNFKISKAMEESGLAARGLAAGAGEADEDVLAPSELFVSRQIQISHDRQIGAKDTKNQGTPVMTLWRLPANTLKAGGIEAERAPLINAMIDDRRGLVAHANSMPCRASSVA